MIIGALDKLIKGFKLKLEDLKIRGRVETIQTTSLRLVRILRRVPRDLRRLAVTQTPTRNHQLTLV